MRPKRSRADSSAGSGTGKTSKTGKTGKENKKREKGQSRGSGGKPVKGAGAGTGGAGGAVKAARKSPDEGDSEEQSHGGLESLVGHWRGWRALRGGGTERRRRDEGRRGKESWRERGEKQTPVARGSSFRV